MVSIQGANLDPSSKIWLAGVTGAPPQLLKTFNAAYPTQLSAALPSSASGGLVIWVANAHGPSNAVKLNGAIPLHLDALEIVAGGAFHILGRNLLMDGFSPVVTVDGHKALVNLAASTSNMLTVAAPSSLRPNPSSTILVDNGNGSGPERLDRRIEVAPGSGDPLSLGVGWGAGFSFVRRVTPIATPCDGVHDDSATIQKAILSASAEGGGLLQLPAGHCVLEHPLEMRSKIVLSGAGKALTFVQYGVDYPISAKGYDLVGLKDLVLTNTKAAREGLLWKNNTRSFLQRLKIESGLSHQLYLDGNSNFAVVDTDFIQGGSLGGQNPYLLSGSSGLLFRNNTSITVDGSPTFSAVHDALFWNNRFTRDASRQYETPVITTHLFVMDFAYRISVIDNTFDAVHGPISNTQRNDGEALLSEGGGPNRTESLGVVQSADCSSLTGASPKPRHWKDAPEDNAGIAIVAGAGMGQSRSIASLSGSKLTVTSPWDVVPDQTSRYALFVWGLEKTLIIGNHVSSSPRGVWLYQAAARDVEISDNTFDGGGGIYLRPERDLAAGQIDPMYNILISHNSIRNSEGPWVSYINLTAVDKDFGSPIAIGIGIEIRANSLFPRQRVSNTEDYAGVEGFTALVRHEGPRPQGGFGGATLIGTILQNNDCAACEAAFKIGPGAIGNVLTDNRSQQNKSRSGAADRAATGGSDLVPPLK